MMNYQKKILQFFSVEYDFISLIERLVKHRIRHLEQFYIQANITPTTSPNSKELSAYMSGQLSLFPKESGNTNLQWNRSKVDFIELFSTVYDCQSIKALDKRKITKKEFIELVMWFFNLNIGNWETTLSAAKSRKLERESPYLKELLGQFSLHFSRSQK